MKIIFALFFSVSTLSASDLTSSAQKVEFVTPLRIEDLKGQKIVFQDTSPSHYIIQDWGTWSDSGDSFTVRQDYRPHWILQSLVVLSMIMMLIIVIKSIRRGDVMMMLIALFGIFQGVKLLI
jgi:hypothetical protein